MTYYHGYYGNSKTQAEKDDEIRELRRRANANLSNPDRCKPVGSSKPQRPAVTANDIQHGHMVIEMRQLLKIEAGYSRRKTLTADETAAWEEVDARLDTLREAFKHSTKAEMTRWVRCYNKSLKAKAV